MCLSADQLLVSISYSTGWCDMQIWSLVFWWYQTFCCRRFQFWKSIGTSHQLHCRAIWQCSISVWYVCMELYHYLIISGNSVYGFRYKVFHSIKYIFTLSVYDVAAFFWIDFKKCCMWILLHVSYVSRNVIVLHCCVVSCMVMI
jgi:hypothetical protein